MQELLRTIIKEDSYNDIVGKQKTVTKLFPSFPERVGYVKDNGGVRFKNWRKDRWDLSVASGTEPGKKYDAIVAFHNIPYLIDKYSKDRTIWVKDKSRVNRTLLAQKVLNDIDVDVLCSCPAFQYWGPAYIMTKRDAKFGKPENRPPKKRNPKEHGAVCKHYQVVLDVLPFYPGTMSKFITRFYDDVVKAAEAKARAQYKDLQTAATALGARQKGVKEPERGPRNTAKAPAPEENPKAPERPEEVPGEEQ